MTKDPIVRWIEPRSNIKLDVGANVLPGAMKFGDVDGDGNMELVVGTMDGDLLVYKGVVDLTPSYSMSDLGTITCIHIGKLADINVVEDKEKTVVEIENEEIEDNVAVEKEIVEKISIVVTSCEGKVHILQVNSTMELEITMTKSIAFNSNAILVEELPISRKMVLIVGTRDCSVHLYEIDLENRSLHLLQRHNVLKPVHSLSMVQDTETSKAIVIGMHDGAVSMIDAKGMLSPFHFNEKKRKVASSVFVCGGIRLKGSIKATSMAQNGDVSLIQSTTRETIRIVELHDPICALQKLDIFNDGRDQIVACSWNGITYVIDPFLPQVNFSIGKPVQGFALGKFSLNELETVIAFVYCIPGGSVYIYTDLVATIGSLTSPTMKIPSLDVKKIKAMKSLLKKILGKQQKKSAQYTDSMLNLIRQCAYMSEEDISKLRAYRDSIGNNSMMGNNSMNEENLQS